MRVCILTKSGSFATWFLPWGIYLFLPRQCAGGYDVVAASGRLCLPVGEQADDRCPPPAQLQTRPDWATRVYSCARSNKYLESRSESVWVRFGRSTRTSSFGKVRVEPYNPGLRGACLTRRDVKEVARRLSWTIGTHVKCTQRKVSGDVARFNANGTVVPQIFRHSGGINSDRHM